MLTWLQLKQICAPYNKRGGSCITDPTVPFFTKSVAQYLLNAGAYGNLHKYTFCAVKGCFTIPFELETIEKIKIDDVVGTSHDRWFDFHAAKGLYGSREWHECLDAARAVQEDPNYYPTVYPLPAGNGWRVGAYGTCQETDDAHLIVQGNDPTGRPIHTFHNELPVSGEYLSIKQGRINYTQTIFGEITGVTKCETNGYVTLYGVNECFDKKFFLADYGPLEQVPAYRRYSLTSPCKKERVKVTALGRIRLKENYSDEDRVPFEMIHLVELAAQAINAGNNLNPLLASADDQAMQVQVQRENDYKTPENGNPVEFYIPLSGGHIRSIF